MLIALTPRQMSVVVVPAVTQAETACPLPSSTANKFILDRKDIPADPNAYVYRDPRRGNGRWSIYFYDRETKERHRLVLKKPDGTYPTPSIEGQDEPGCWESQNVVKRKSCGEAIRSLLPGEK